MEACRNAEAVVIVTEWKEFREIDWKEVYAHMNKPAFVFDGRLLVNVEELKEIGFKVGRPIYDWHSFLTLLMKVASIGRGEKL